MDPPDIVISQSSVIISTPGSSQKPSTAASNVDAVPSVTSSSNSSPTVGTLETPKLVQLHITEDIRVQARNDYLCDELVSAVDHALQRYTLLRQELTLLLRHHDELAKSNSFYQKVIGDQLKEHAADGQRTAEIVGHMKKREGYVDQMYAEVLGGIEDTILVEKQRLIEGNTKIEGANQTISRLEDLCRQRLLPSEEGTSSFSNTFSSTATRLAITQGPTRLPAAIGAVSTALVAKPTGPPPLGYRTMPIQSGEDNPNFLFLVPGALHAPPKIPPPTHLLKLLSSADPILGLIEGEGMGDGSTVGGAVTSLVSPTEPADEDVIRTKADLIRFLPTNDLDSETHRLAEQLEGPLADYRRQMQEAEIAAAKANLSQQSPSHKQQPGSKSEDEVEDALALAARVESLHVKI